MNTKNEIFSFHLIRLPIWKLPHFVFCPMHLQAIPGLNFSKSFFTMNLGEPIVSPLRYNFRTFALFAWWSEEKYLEDFLQQTSFQDFTLGWHVRLKLYRRWGEIRELKHAMVNTDLVSSSSVVAVTLARLKLTETQRFTQWGKPVESQVRNHPGKNLAVAAFRPLNTFSTFTIWRNEAEMINMVQGKKAQDGEGHKLAMQERNRKDFHHEFTTMRFIPIGEYGSWNEKSGYTTID